MKSIITTAIAAAALFVVACGEAKKEEQPAASVSTPAPGTDTTKTAEPESAPPDSATMTKAWMEFMTPGPMHKLMAGMEGKWEVEMVSWMGPDAPPSPPSKVTAEYKSILNGLYLQSEYKGNVEGMGKFEGRGFMAYDNARRKFISTWIDSWGSGLLYLEGEWDENSKTLTMTGKSTDPVTGKQIDFREVTRVTDDKHHVSEMYSSHSPGGKEFKMLELRLTKK